MTPDELKRLYPLVLGWMQKTLAEHAAKAKPVASLGFRGLPRFYTRRFLARAKVVMVDRCPMVPLSSFGIDRFAAFERYEPTGITYLDTYFVVPRDAERESLHFHELVHVVQWQELGAERFLSIYASYFEKPNKRDNPLEDMAYAHQEKFEVGVSPYSVEDAVRQELAALLAASATRPRRGRSNRRSKRRAPGG